jgi:cell division protein FtsB
MKENVQLHTVVDELRTENKKLRRALDNAPRHQDDCDRVQDISGRAPCNCAEIGRKLRTQVKQLQEQVKQLKADIEDFA